MSDVGWVADLFGVVKALAGWAAAVGLVGLVWLAWIEIRDFMNTIGRKHK